MPASISASAGVHPAAKPHHTSKGQREESHVVVHGETLSGIARSYHRDGWVDLANWWPVYNLTRKRTGLWAGKHRPNQTNNPDLIYPGDVLVIPRSRAGYQSAISNLVALQNESRNAPNTAAEVQEQERNFSEGLNLASNVLTFIGTLGASAVTSARVAKTTVRAVAGEALRKKTLSILELGTNIVEYGAKSTGHEKVAQYARATGKVLHAADLVGDAKDFRKEGKELLADKRYWRLAGESLGRVVDFLDVAFMWTEPSELSKGFIRLYSGCDVDATIAENVQYQERMREKMIELLQTKISGLRAEMILVYAN